MDKIDMLNSRLKEVVEKFNEWKDSGMDEEILIAYIIYETKLPKRDVKKILESVDTFHKRLVNKEVLKKI